MLQPGRHANTSDYRYGFQGQEMDDEIKGEGNSINFKYRMHDPRVGRFFAVDPLEKKYARYSPYSFSFNQVVHTYELEGLEAFKDLMNAHDPIFWKMVDNYGIDESIKAKKAFDQSFLRTAAVGVPITASIIMSGGTSLSVVSFRGIGSVITKLGTRSAIVGGINGAILEGGFSALEGDDAHEVFKNSLGGFASGLVLGAGGTTTKQLLKSGFVAGGADELIKQSLDIAFNGKEGIELNKVAKSAGITAVANVLSAKILKEINNAISSEVSSTLKYMGGEKYKDMISKTLSKQFPHLKTSGKYFKNLVNETIKENMSLITKQGEQGRIVIEKIIEGASTKVENIVKDKINE